jgi:uncharacterized protein YukE
MTTVTAADSDWQKQWDKDLNDLEEGIKKSKGSTDKYNADRKEYYEKILPDFYELCEKNPERALAYFFAKIMTSVDPSNQKNILGIYDDKTKIFGNQMSVNAHLTSLTSDLQNLLNGTSNVPEGEQLATANRSIEALNKKLKDLVDKNVLDPALVGTLQKELDNIQTITTLGPDNKYFTNDPNDKTKLHSFTEMKQVMSDKNDSRFENAIEAAKSFTDSNSIMTQTSQNISAVLNQRISQSTGMQKNWMNFLSSFMKSDLSLYNAINQNTTKG